MKKFLLSIITSAFIMTTAGAVTALDTQKTVEEAPEVIKVNTGSGSSELETKAIDGYCPPFCW